MVDENKSVVAVGPVEFRRGMLSRRFSIDASASGWGILAGTLRPATAREARDRDLEMLDERAKPKGGDPVGVKARFYAAHIHNWNLVDVGYDGAKTPIPVSAEVVAALPLPWWDALEELMTGYAAEPILGNSAGS